MDGVPTIHIPKRMATFFCEDSGGRRNPCHRRHHVMAESSGDQFHHGPLAVRIYVAAPCVVSSSAGLSRNSEYTGPARIAPYLKPGRTDWPSMTPRPVACVIWLLIAVILLYFMKASIQIFNPADPSIRYNILGLMALPYTTTPRRHSHQAIPNSSSIPSHENEEEMNTIHSPHSSALLDPSKASSQPPRNRPQLHASSSSTTLLLDRSPTALLVRGSNCVTIRIVMPSSFGFRSWRWYETIVETLAVGIYLYATFILTSLLFLNADRAIEYATLMALCLSVVRILTVLF